jgi:hypothetical protein
MHAELSSRLRLDEPQYQASEVLIGAILSGARYEERPVTMRLRQSGASKKGGNLVYGYRYGRVVLRTYLRDGGPRARLSRPRRTVTAAS